MPYIIVFTAGVVVGTMWGTAKKFLSPFVAEASERFDTLYAETAQKAGQKVEDIEDRIAERRYHATKKQS